RSKRDMSGWDEGRVFISGGGGFGGLQAQNELAAAAAAVQEKFLKFIRGWKNQDNSFIYREQLTQRYNLEQYYLEVNIEHLSQFDANLTHHLMTKPNDVIPHFERAAKEAVHKMKYNMDITEINDIQVLFISSQEPSSIRTLKASHIARLVRIPGIVISASRTQPRPVRLVGRCRSCGHDLVVDVPPGITVSPLPLVCEKSLRDGTQCGNNPYYIMSDKSKFVNQQILKLQESPDSIPTGEMPRHIQLTLDRCLVERITPGTRISVLGVFGIYQGIGGRKKEVAGSATIRQPYVRALGITSDTDKGGRSNYFFTPKEEDAFKQFSKRADLYEHISSNIAPSIYGHGDIKKAITCQLFGGSLKRLPDKMRLRGDINLLLLGDPGTAKSQLLKFVEKVAPISVYTSGKGSSAAGLTASVIREPSTGEYYLEGGAMVVADGGVVCIDEFDKMDVNDRVAIHEAMEQQTISIAKAGITTILNSRTSVLAAANPVFGRYDDLKSAGENIDFQATILSRFDMIFIVRDPRNMARDMKIVDHVLRIHQQGANVKSDNGQFDNFLKKYISYCRSRCSPRLSDDAIEALKNHYVSVRATVRMQQDEGQAAAIPITIRQLEAIVRISESLAKMSLSNNATITHVMEAIRLFTISTFDAITTNNAVGETLTPQILQEVLEAETLIKRRLPIGSKSSTKKIVSELSGKVSSFSIRKALDILVKRDEFEYRFQGKIIQRKS
ncbi:hypothetical protein SAMD00019534_031240, partial [Acytostelium subglobosum LB1]|uniref:hypothetical protein n=1 Tax=Acytostelium subglobosum LB1 TaxID=1410327 RepID=UPI000644BB81